LWRNCRKLGKNSLGHHWGRGARVGEKKKTSGEGGSGRGEEEGKIAIAHLYWATTRAGRNVLTFVQGDGSDRYKCTSLTFVPVGATDRYTCVAFLLGGWEMALTQPCERAFVPVGVSNWYKCSYLYRGQKYPVQIKNGHGIYVRFSSSDETGRTNIIFKFLVK
jgi:hypothetical protein